MSALLTVGFPAVPEFDQAGHPSHAIGWNVYINRVLVAKEPLDAVSRTYPANDYGDYDVQVSLVNELGEGARSPATRVSYVQPRGLPSQPGAPSVTLDVLGAGIPPVVGGGGSDPTPEPSSTFIGVPDPDWGATIGNPITYATPSRPVDWSSEVPGYYFVNNQTGTNTGRTYGTPTAPRSTLPSPMPAGAYVELEGTYSVTTGGAIRINAAGSSTQPVFVKAAPAGGSVVHNGDCTVEGQYTFFEGLTFSCRVQARTALSAVWDHHCFRGGTHKLGNQGTITGGALLAVGPGQDLVVYNNTFEDSHPDWNTGVADLDVHGHKVGNVAGPSWILGNTYQRIAGNAIQFGDQNTSDRTQIHHIYFSGNTVLSTRQSAIGIKRCTKIFITGNDVSGAHMIQAGNWAGGITMQYGPDEVWIVGNKIHDFDLGLKGVSMDTNQGPNNRIYFVGNDVFNINNANGDWTNGGSGAANAFNPGAALSVVHASELHVVNNSLDAPRGGIRLNDSTDVPLNAENNIIYGVDTGSYRQISSPRANTPSISVLKNNIFEVNGSIYWGSSSAQTPSAVDASNLNGDPLFVSTTNHRLQSGSPARDAGVADTSLDVDVYALFQTNFGIDIREDRDGTVRPQNSVWDMGAYEFS